MIYEEKYTQKAKRHKNKKGIISYE